MTTTSASSPAIMLTLVRCMACGTPQFEVQGPTRVVFKCKGKNGCGDTNHQRIV